jgi:acyl-CoA reductase-like NAD-dependent aldehyde dehydrogenase
MFRPIIGGREFDVEESFSVVNPFDGSLVDEIGCADASLVDRALGHAAEAGDRVRRLTRDQRSRILRDVSEGGKDRG